MLDLVRWLKDKDSVVMLDGGMGTMLAEAGWRPPLLPEEMNLVNPTAGTYVLAIDGYATGNPTAYKAFVWRLGSTSTGNMAVAAPATATLGATGNVDLTFSGLTPGVRYLGSVAYDGAAGMPSPTIVRVDP